MSFERRYGGVCLKRLWDPFRSEKPMIVLAGLIFANPFYASGGSPPLSAPFGVILERSEGSRRGAFLLEYDTERERGAPAGNYWVCAYQYSDGGCYPLFCTAKDEGWFGGEKTSAFEMVSPRHIISFFLL